MNTIERWLTDHADLDRLDRDLLLAGVLVITAASIVPLLIFGWDDEGPPLTRKLARKITPPKTPATARKPVAPKAKPAARVAGKPVPKAATGTEAETDGNARGESHRPYFHDR